MVHYILLSYSAFIKYHLLAPYRPVEVDFVGFEVHFKPDIGQVIHDIGQVMISDTFILTKIVPVVVAARHYFPLHLVNQPL